MTNGGRRADVREIFIEFDGRQVLFRTDVDEISEHMMDAHANMLVTRVTHCIGELEVARTRGGYSIRGDVPFDVAGPPSMFFDLVQHSILEKFLHYAGDLLWFHGSAAHRDGYSVVIPAPSGRGKTTLVSGLCDIGWNYMSDEYAPIRMGENAVVPYPRSAHRRVNKGRPLEPEAALSLERERWNPAEGSVHNRPSPVAMIVFPRYGHGMEPKASEISGGEASLELISNCMNFGDHRAVAVARVADLVTSVPCYTFYYDDRVKAAKYVDGLASRLKSSV